MRKNIKTMYKFYFYLNSCGVFFILTAIRIPIFIYNIYRELGSKIRYNVLILLIFKRRKSKQKHFCFDFVTITRHRIIKDKDVWLTYNLTKPN